MESAAWSPYMPLSSKSRDDAGRAVGFSCIGVAVSIVHFLRNTLAELDTNSLFLFLYITSKLVFASMKSKAFEKIVELSLLFYHSIGCGCIEEVMM